MEGRCRGEDGPECGLCFFLSGNIGVYDEHVKAIWPT